MESQLETHNTELNYVKVNVLGTEYTIHISNEKTYPLLKEIDGYTDTSIKAIIVDDCNHTTPDSKQDLERYRRSVIRHEIIHAFLYESGLDANANGVECWATNEEMVDWLAIQFPKMLKAFREAECL